MVFKWVLTLIKWWFCILIKIKGPKLKGWWWFLYPIQGFSTISNKFSPTGYPSEVIAWLIKVINFTSCVHHSPSFFHTFLNHLHPFPPCPIRQKAKKTKRNSRPLKPGKTKLLCFPGQQVSMGSPCVLARPYHFSPWPFLSLSFPWCEVWFGIPLPSTFTSNRVLS